MFVLRWTIIALVEINPNILLWDVDILSNIALRLWECAWKGQYIPRPNSDTVYHLNQRNIEMVSISTPSSEGYILLYTR